MRGIMWVIVWAIIGFEGVSRGAEAMAPPAAATDAVGIAQYTLAAGPLRIERAPENCSGLAFNPDTKTLFVVQNKPTRITELNLDGKPRRAIALDGFDDTEDLTYIGKGKFAVIEERRRNLCEFTLGAGITAVSYGSAEKTLVDPVDADNSGTEGVAYDAVGKRFFVVKEKHPRKIYVVPLSTDRKAPPPVTTPWDIEEDSLGCRDLSGIYYHAGTGHLLILSDESKCVVEATTDGREIGKLSLRAGSAGMTADAPQPEGITMDDAGALYICSEPDLLYVFTKKK